MIDTIDAATTSWNAASGMSPSARPIVARMNENSPICASPAATIRPVRAGRRKATTIRNAASGFATTMSSTSTTATGCASSIDGSNSIPTDTKNSTANASRSGRASSAA